MQTEEQRRAGFLRALNYGWLAMGLAALVCLPFYPEEQRLLSTIVLITAATFLSVHFLNRGERTRLAAGIFVLVVDAAFYLFFYINLIELGAERALETQANVLMMAGLAIIFSGLLIDRWAPFIFALVNSLALIITIASLAPASDPRFSVHVFWWLLALSIWLYETSFAKAFAHMRDLLANLDERVEARTATLQKTIRQLEEAQRRLEASNQELKTFTSSVSHDLRAPLRAIDGYSRIVVEDYADQIPPEALAFLQKARAGTRRMNKMIDDLLTFARLGWRPIEKQTFHSGQMVRDLVEDLRLGDADRRVEWSIGDLPNCQADPALLLQVWSNLLLNAQKFTRPRQEARIEIGCQQVDGENVYFVRDNGVGFDMQYASRLFGIFQRLHTENEFEGAGIGLATAQRIVQRHSGRIWAEAELDRGATFYFVLQ